MSDGWIKVPAETVRLRRERPLRLSAGMDETLAPTHNRAVYVEPITPWWRDGQASSPPRR